MRLWHYKLIPYLPQKQLVAQWRECCCIAKNIADNGTPNHILVNEVLNYPTIHFIEYTNMILKEMNKRGYKVTEKSYLNFCENIQKALPCFCDKYNCSKIIDNQVLWHDDIYLQICLYNLYEKALCGGMSNNEWQLIEDEFKEYM